MKKRIKNVLRPRKKWNKNLLFRITLRCQFFLHFQCSGSQQLGQVKFVNKNGDARPGRFLNAFEFSRFFPFEPDGFHQIKSISVIYKAGNSRYFHTRIAADVQK